MDQITAAHMDDYQFLHQLPFFNPLTKNALWALTSLFVRKHFDKDEFLIKEGDDPVGIFILKSGHVQVLKKAIQADIVMGKLGPGEILGEISVIDKLKTTATIQAIEPVECLFISEWDFSVQMDAYPPIALELLKVLVRRFRHLYEKIK